MSETIGFIGLGGMGAVMAASLLDAGFALVYNRTPHRAEPLVHRGAVQVSSIAEAVEEGGIVITMLTNDAAVEAVAFGDSGFGRGAGNRRHSRLHEYHCPGNVAALGPAP